MNYTSTAICNLALDEVKASNIASLNEASRSAVVCRRQYPQALGELLENGNWEFARRRIVLAAIPTNDRAAEWRYAYGLPSGVAIPIRLLPPQPEEAALIGDGGQYAPVYAVMTEEPIPYDIANGVIFSNQEQAVLEFVIDSPDTGVMTHSFVKALYFSLAAKIIMPVKGGPRDEQRLLLQEANVFLERAMAKNNNRQRQTYGNFVPDSIKARMGYGDDGC